MRTIHNCGLTAESAIRKSRQGAGFTAALTVMTMLCSSPVRAEGWELMYLDWGGGTRLMVVEPSQATQIDAVVWSSDIAGLLFGLDCMGQMRVANGDPFMGDSAELIADFDDGTTFALGTVSYAGGAYYGTFPAEAAAVFDRSGNLKISDPGNGFAATFSLQGFAPAHDQVNCSG